MFSDTKELYSYIRELGIDVVDFKMVDLWGRWRHISAPARKITQKVLEEGFAFDCDKLGFAQKSQNNLIFIPDPATAFEEEWGDIRVLSLICNVHSIEKDTPRFVHDPRFICEKAEAAVGSLLKDHQLHLLPCFEFYVFDTAKFENKPNYTFYWLESEAAGWNPEHNNLGYYVRSKQGYQATPPQDTLFDFRNRLVAMLQEGKVPVRHHHHNVGSAGHIRIEVDFNTPRRTADSFMMLKYIAKNLASKIAKTATFMPKPIHGEAGSSLCLNAKLMNLDKNLFLDPEGYRGMSREALYFIGGLLSHGNSLMAFTNPSTNSYKRIINDSDAPSYHIYSASDRKGAVRIPTYAKWEEDKCFEYGVPDASCNPYLAFAAFIMAGLDGIRNKIDPKEAGFGPFDEAIDGNEDSFKKMPTSLRKALDALKNDNNYLLEGDVFSKDFIDYWIKLKMEREVIPISSRPHPHEFVLYYDL